MPISVLLSVKPSFASAILDGTKTFEFRRVRFAAPGVRKVVLYASSPVSRVIGEFVVSDILSMRPAALWQATHRGAGISRAYFDEYFAGRSLGFALKVDEPRRYRVPRVLRGHYGISRPPQSFCYLD